MASFDLPDLEKRIQERAKASAEVTRLASSSTAGVSHCAKKLGEEAVEAALAAVGEDREHMIAEAADRACTTCWSCSMPAAFCSPMSRANSIGVRASRGWTRRRRARAAEGRGMEQRTQPDVSPDRVFSRAEWAKLRADTPMTLEAGGDRAAALDA